VKLCTKNYKNLSIFVKVTAKKISGTFFLDTVLSLNAVLQRIVLASIRLLKHFWKENGRYAT